MITLRVLSSAPCNDSWGISMFSSVFRTVAPYLGTVVGFFFVWVSFVAYRYAGSPFTIEGVLAWSAGIIVLLVTCAKCEAEILVLPALFLMVAGGIAMAAAVALFIPWVWWTALAGQNGGRAEQAMSILAPLGYIVLTAYAFLCVRNR